MEEDILPRSDLTTIQWSRHLNVGNEAKGHSLVNVVATEVDVEVVANLLQTLAELTSMPSLEL
jgi:hypothetical protein